MKQIKKEQPQRNLKIYDARPQLNATFNRVHGKGTENTNLYRNCTLTYLNIDHIHKARNAYKKMKELFIYKSKDSKWP